MSSVEIIDFYKTLGYELAVELPHYQEKLPRLAQILINCGGQIFEEFTRSEKRYVIRIYKENLPIFKEELESVHLGSFRDFLKQITKLVEGTQNELVEIDLIF